MDTSLLFQFNRPELDPKFRRKEKYAIMNCDAMMDSTTTVEEVEDVVSKSVVVFEVERILSKKVVKSKGRKRRVHYLIKWKGFNDFYNTWEPVSNLEGCRQMLFKFNRNANRRALIQTKNQALEQRISRYDYVEKSVAAQLCLLYHSIQNKL